VKTGRQDAKVCHWCGEKFWPRSSGGTPQRFCSPSHRQSYNSTARRYTEMLVQRGEVTVEQMKAATAAYTLGGDAETNSKDAGAPGAM